MSAVDGLRFGGGIPPGVEQVHVLGLDQVEPHASRLETDQKRAERRVLLKPFHLDLAIFRLAVEVGVADAGLIQVRDHQAEQLGELREHQGLVATRAHHSELLDLMVELGTGAVFLGVVEQSGVTRGLAQS
jgi:hypothetical protein